MKNIYLLFLLLIIFESCNNKKVEPITPIANFSFELGKNGEVKFINTSQNASKFQWEFGDGESSTEMNPIHTYKTENVYKVKLIVNSDEKNKNEIIQEINITNFTPKASFEYSIGENGLVKFKNTSINSKTFAWSFGDGNRSTEANPSNTYKTNAKYKVNLIAINSNSRDSMQIEIQISNILELNKEIKETDLDKIPYLCVNNYKLGDFSIIVDSIKNYCQFISIFEWRTIENGKLGFHEIMNVDGKPSSVIIASRDFMMASGFYNAVLIRCDVIGHRTENIFDSNIPDYWVGKIPLNPNGKIKITSIIDNTITGTYYFKIKNHVITGTFKNLRVK
jgi:PKD repeat protein